VLIEAFEPVSGETLHYSEKSSESGFEMGVESGRVGGDVHLCTLMLLIFRVFLILEFNFISGALAKLFECCAQLQPDPESRTRLSRESRANENGGKSSFTHHPCYSITHHHSKLTP
jgi:hypothetical protein